MSEQALTKIESDIPIPAQRSNGKWKQLLSQMKVGDSFFMPVAVGSLSARMNHAKKALKIKLTARTENGGTRVWRIE